MSALDTEPVTDPQPLEPPPFVSTEPPAEWQVDAVGREFVRKLEGRGMLYRRGGETVEEAYARAADGAAPGAKRRTRTPNLPKGPKKVDLRALELTLAEALKTPAMMAASFGDEWGADHFTRAGPYLARNLVLASEHNPWLRSKLEEASTGQDAMMKMVSLIGVGGAAITYVIPPVIYYLNLPVPEKTRAMFGVPPRKEHAPAYTAPSEDGWAGAREEGGEDAAPTAEPFAA